MKPGMTFDEMLAAASTAPRRKGQRDIEHRLQMQCVRWFNIAYPDLRGRLFAVPNGGRRDAVTGARLKAEGVMAGVADLILLKSNARHGALLIEMKAPGGRQSQAQRDWQAAVTAAGEYRYAVCRTLDDFRREVDGYLGDTQDY